jgi:hypothetical protein
MLESERFSLLKKDRLHFEPYLRDIANYDHFIEIKLYAKFEFKQAYNEFFIEPTQEEEREHSASKLTFPEVTQFDKEELNKKLIINNQEIFKVIALDKTLKLNVALEMPCEAFALQYASYRTKDTSFCIDCDQILRRDEYAEHYSLFHNFLLGSCEDVHLNCPMQDYGCEYFKQRVEFFYGGYSFSKTDGKKKFDIDYPAATLVDNKMSGNLTFRLDYLDYESPELSENSETGKTILDLPFEVMFEIVDHLDSLSLFSLSMASKVI